MKLTALQLAALAASAILAIAYGAYGSSLYTGEPPFIVGTIFKASSIVILGLIALRVRSNLLATGLLFGALGDALAVALLDARGFREDDFARSHPGGSLGRKLLMHVRDLMRSGDAVPKVPPDATFNMLLREMTGKGLGFSAVVDGEGRAIGIFTDGDLRRLIERGAEFGALRAHDVMHTRPKLVRADALAVEAAEVMEQHRVTSVLVVDDDARLVGALNSNDLMRAKVI